MSVRSQSRIGVRAMLTGGILRFVVEDAGQDLVEYALLSGTIGIAGILLYPSIRDAMSALFTNSQAAAQNLWEPCAPAPAACP